MLTKTGFILVDKQTNKISSQQIKKIKDLSTQTHQQTMDKRQ